MYLLSFLMPYTCFVHLRIGFNLLQHASLLCFNFPARLPLWNCRCWAPTKSLALQTTKDASHSGHGSDTAEIASSTHKVKVHDTAVQELHWPSARREALLHAREAG